MNTNTFEVTGGRSFEPVEETAVQNDASTTTQKVVFFLVWAAVSAPMIWGVLKAWDEAKLIF